ncbi:MAG: hypothetical protein H0W06_01005 [Chloroflexia bacterium]|nr:hypothetical protein [Chloroflexia bacterium]
MDTTGGARMRHLEDEWPVSLGDAVAAPALVCPGCGSDLGGDDVFRTHRVCGGCRRHFPLRARERLALIADAGSFRALPLAVESVAGEKPLPGVPAIRADRARTALGAAVVAGRARIGGSESVLVILDDELLGPALGAVVAETIIRAFELALARSLPLVTVCAGGAARTRSGPLALAQGARLAATASRLHLAAVPMVAVLTHPTAAGVFGALAAQCDIILAEPGTQVGTEFGAPSPASSDRSIGVATLLAGGALDGIVDRVKLRGYLGSLLDLVTRRGTPRRVERTAVGRASPSAWEAVAAARHPERPDAAFYLRSMVDDFTELHGDRLDADSPGLVGGLGRLDDLAVAVVALRGNSGAASAATARKAMRIARLAGHLELPLVLLTQSPGLAAGAESTAPDPSLAVAQLLGLLVVLPVPIVAVAVGEVREPMASALMTGDRVLIQDHAVYAAGAVNGGFGRRLESAGHAGVVGGPSSPVLTARECRRLGLVDDVVAEPEPAAHADPAWAAMTLRGDVSAALGELVGVGPRRLLETRQRRLRHLGQSTPEGQAAARSELHELHEWQRSLRRSFGELRERWERREHLTIARPHVPRQRPDLPELSDIAQRLATLRAEAGRVSSRRPSRVIAARRVRVMDSDDERTRPSPEPGGHDG